MPDFSEEELLELPWPTGFVGFPKAMVKANGIVQIITGIVSIIVSGVMFSSEYVGLVLLKPLISF